jgi:PAS domain S-box-containing protein
MNTKSIKVLVIEDNPGDARLIEEMLHEADQFIDEVVVASRLSEGIEQIEANAFDAALVDLSLPDSTGIATCQRMAAAAPDLPITVVTGYDDPSFALEALQAGAQDYVVKGELSGRELSRTVRYAIERHRMLARVQEQADEIEASERRLHTLLDGSVDGIIVIDQEGVIRFANPAAEALFGKRAEALIGEVFGQPIAPRWGVELDVIRPDGSKAIAEMHVVLTTWEGSPAYLLTLRNVTERKRAEAAEREQRTLIETLDNVAATINSSLELDEVLGLILDAVARIVPYDGANIMLFAEQGGEIKQVRGRYARTDIAQQLRAAELDANKLPLLNQMMNTRQPIIIPDAQNHPGWVTIPGMEWIRSYIGVPIISRGEIIGFINVDSAAPDAYNETHAGWLRTLADQAAIAVDNARLYEASRRRAQELETLRQMALSITNELQLDDLLHTLVSNAVRLLGTNAGGFFLYQPEHDVLEWRVNVGRKVIPPHFTLKKGEGLSGRVWASGEPKMVTDYESWEGRADRIQPAGVRGMIGVPVHWSGRFLGVLLAYHTGQETSTGFTEHDAHLLSLFADQAAIAIQNAQLYRELENYSTILEQAVANATSDLQRTLEQLSAIVDNSPDAILRLTLDGQIESTNPAFERMFAYDPDALAGKSVARLICAGHAGTLTNAFNEVQQTRRPSRLEVVACSASGNEFDADVALAPIIEEGVVVGIVCSIRDISALKEVERMKDSFLSTAAHELRTPLTSVLGYSEILLTRDLTEKRSERYLSFIHNESRHLVEILDDLLDLARLESRQGLTITWEPFDLGRVIREVIDLLADISPDHVFRLEGLETLPMVHGDPFRLTQVMRNLVSNAIKYSPEGGEIVIDAAVADGAVRISIRDKGIGMTAEQQAHLFQKFYRADSSNTSIGGTGLGLAICKLIVEGHGGEIWAESTPGEGSTFAFTLPTKPPEDKNQPTIQPDPPGAESR